MPDYIYLLENRLSADQQSALQHLRHAAREAEMILFLTGDAVRDLTSGHAVRDIEIAVHGKALDLKHALAHTPAQIWGEDETTGSLYLCFPGTVRVDVVSTHRVTYPKPGQPVYHPASIHEDLRRRDFTVNAMAISLNEGSYGLLMDPLNGAADIEARTLRLVSNYGFLEDPALLIRATRYQARLGWELDPKTRTRYENAKGEGVIDFLSAHARSQELEQIGHEDDGLKVLHALEAEGWMKVLYPAWTPAKADEEKLKALHSLAVDFLMQGVRADVSAAQMQLLTAKMNPKELAALKKQMLRPGFVEEWNSLDALAAGFAKVLLSKENQIPSAGYRLFTSYDPEAVLWLGFTSKDAAIKERFNLFLKVWPETKQRIPYAVMQEMRIRAELPNYNEIVQSIFLQMIDGKLSTPEEIKAFLEPYSPPAPPPQVTIKRTRGRRGAEPKVKDSFDDDEESEEGVDGEDDLDDMGGDEDEIGIGMGLPKVELDSESADDADADDVDDTDSDDEDTAEEEPVPVKRGASKGAALTKPGKHAPAVETPSPSRAKAPAKGLPESRGTGNGADAVSKPAQDHKAGSKHAGAASAPIKGAGQPPAEHSPGKHESTHGKTHTSVPGGKKIESHGAKTTSVVTPAHDKKKVPAKSAAKSAAKTSPKTHAKATSSSSGAHKSPNGSKAHKISRPAPKKHAGKKH